MTVDEKYLSLCVVGWVGVLSHKDSPEQAGFDDLLIRKRMIDES